MFAWHVQFRLDSLLECLVSVVWKWSLSDAGVAEWTSLERVVSEVEARSSYYERFGLVFST